MFGWFRAASVCASRVNRARRSGSAANSSGRTLSATSRFSFVSRARYTSPMPPAPIGARISYGPRLVPEVRAIGVGFYSSRWMFGMTRMRQSRRRLQAGDQPGPGDFPIALHRDDGNVQHLGDFFLLQTTEET